jgi:predicted secreted protein
MLLYGLSSMMVAWIPVVGILPFIVLVLWWVIDAVLIPGRIRRLNNELIVSLGGGPSSIAMPPTRKNPSLSGYVLMFCLIFGVLAALLYVLPYINFSR